MNNSIENVLVSFIIILAAYLVDQSITETLLTNTTKESSRTTRRMDLSKYNLSLFDTSFEVKDSGPFVYIESKPIPQNITQPKPKLKLWKTKKNITQLTMKSKRRLPKKAVNDFEIEILEYDDNDLGEGHNELMVAKTHDPFGNSLKKKDFESSTSSREQMDHETRDKRGVVHLYNMITCATSCDPVSYKGYGCFCGFLGEGRPVDGIDRCCQIHDRCYENRFCPVYSVYFQPYYWRCINGEPHCAIENFWNGPGINSCAGRLCECDRELALCLSRYRCVNRRALCRASPLRLLQNLLMF